MWMLQALCDDFEVTVVTRGGWNLEELNRSAGTAIPADAIRILSPPGAQLRFAGAFWLALFYRYCRKLARGYELCITTSRVIDWGGPALHFLTDVTWNFPLQREFASAEFRAREGWIRSLYWRLADLLAGQSGRNPQQEDLFIANSQWTANRSRPYCRRKPIVIYPPVPGGFAHLTPWGERENAFVCLGRIAPEKNIEQVIAILEEARKADAGLTLHLLGRFDSSPYCAIIAQSCAARNEWITLHDGLYGEAKEELLGRCRYGISACQREAFGIATAEMLKAGIIPFVPQQGAQHELVGDQRIIYESMADVGEKIRQILDSKSLQLQLHHQSLQRGAIFGTECFMAEVNRIVKEQQQRCGGGR